MRVTSPVTFPITSRAGKVMLHAVLLVYSAGVVPLQLSFWYTVRRRERERSNREREKGAKEREKQSKEREKGAKERGGPAAPLRLLATRGHGLARRAEGAAGASSERPLSERLSQVTLELIQGGATALGALQESRTREACGPLGAEREPREALV